MSRDIKGNVNEKKCDATWQSEALKSGRVTLITFFYGVAMARVAGCVQVKVRMC